MPFVKMISVVVAEDVSEGKTPTLVKFRSLVTGKKTHAFIFDISYRKSSSMLKIQKCTISLYKVMLICGGESNLMLHCECKVGKLTLSLLR